VADLLRDGIAAAKSGQRDRARDILTRVVDQDERNALAWLWLSSVVDGLEEREICLGNVLALDPNNVTARKGLDWVHEQKELESHAAAMRESPVVARIRNYLGQNGELVATGCTRGWSPVAESGP